MEQIGHGGNDVVSKRLRLLNAVGIRPLAE